MRIRPGQILRLLHINRVLIKHGLDEIVFATHLFRPVRFALYLLPWTWFRRTRAPRAVRLRLALEELGPLFVKFGQILSTRRDLLPDDIADEFARLQDDVAPFPGAVAREIVERAYGQPLGEVFTSFDETPLASASIAQVHAAELPDGSAVIVKVVRPGIRTVIRRDVGLLHTLAELAERYWPEGRRLRPREVVTEYEKTILDELDLMREAANASQLRRNFAGSPVLYVPEVYWPQTRGNVMVMERISGIPIGDIDALRRAGIDLKALSERGVEIFFTQVFRHNFFHADMHPGNIFVSPEGRYIAVDFGIMGALSPEDQRYLAENVLAFFNRDDRRVAELHVESGWVPAGTRIDEFEAAIRTVCEPIFERPLKDISFGRLLLHLFQTARRFNMVIQPQLVLLQKTLLNIEGLGRQLYPDLDLWNTAKPFLERWMSEHVGVFAMMNAVKTRFPHWLDKLAQLPDLAFDTLKRAHDEKLRLEWHSPQLDELSGAVRRANRRTVAAVAGSGLLICAALLYGLDRDSAPLLAWLSGALGVAALGWTWWRD
ncbi:MAG: ubiquinone biosynthesis regulatory protein kinase UbiB [Gammaproteobacteria bacterium]|nr:ubiquinone biosynthesis regulatory protein kinase UbiB [Gammaproteobacteria bacterium]